KSDGPFRPLTGRTGWLMHPGCASHTPPDRSKKTAVIQGRTTAAVFLRQLDPYAVLAAYR
ncbi:MAG: hypothetical protein MSC54_08245, partial [Clostridiales bacterium]|nr:hypothetical protein [Clostridiales bacterium]